MAIIIEAPNDVYSIQNNKNIKLFMAGGITNCPDWQSELIKKIKDIDGLTVYNPRRKNFPIKDPNASNEQITWEYNKLKENISISIEKFNTAYKPVEINGSKMKEILYGINEYD